MEIGFSAYSGSDFLWFYALLLVAACAAALWLPGRLKPEGRGARPDDAELLAYLVGGPARLADSVIAALMARGALRVENKKLVPTGREEGQSKAERALLHDYNGYGWNQVLSVLAGHADAAERQLVSQGLLMRPEERTRVRLLSAAPFAVLLVIGLFRLQAGIAEGEPVGFLIGLLVVTAIIAIVRLVLFNPRTHCGDDALQEARQDAARLRSAPTSGETGLAVGLFGTAVLVGTPFDGLHAMRQDNGGGGGYAGSDGGGDGGSGCGGGGCGGCGG